MTILEELRRNQRRVLDRLVDSELGPQQRREVLAALDEEPGAWRECALAFLEAQAWRLQLSRAAAEPILAQLTATDKPGRSRRLWGAWLATAASVLLAFAVGTRFPSSATTSPPSVANDTSAQPMVATTETPAAARDDTDRTANATGMEMLTLTPVGGDPGDAMQVQMIPLEGDDSSALAGPSWAISNCARAAI